MLAFMAQRAAALVRFADLNGEALVVPQDKRLDSKEKKKPTPAEAKERCWCASLASTARPSR